VLAAQKVKCTALLRNPVMRAPPSGEKIMFEFTDEHTLWD
jgi:hypothetical protein